MGDRLKTSEDAVRASGPGKRVWVAPEASEYDCAEATLYSQGGTMTAGDGHGMYS